MHKKRLYVYQIRLAGVIVTSGGFSYETQRSYEGQSVDSIRLGGVIAFSGDFLIRGSTFARSSPKQASEVPVFSLLTLEEVDAVETGTCQSHSHP